MDEAVTIKEGLADVNMKKLAIEKLVAIRRVFIVWVFVE